MTKSNPTLAIYGIQDRENYEYPFYVHDHNLAIFQNGKLVNFIQQERISRRKRDNTLHIYLKEILKDKRLLGTHFDIVFVDNVVGRSFITREGNVRFEAPLNQHLSIDKEKGKCWWFGHENKAWVLNHELAHMYSCVPFFGNFKDNSLLVHFDGGGSLSNFSACIFKNNKLSWVEYHWEMKPYSSIYNSNALVFAIIGAKLSDQNAVPGKFMGFAGWGKYNNEIETWLEKNKLFHDIWGHTSVFFKKAKTDFNIDLKSFDKKNKFIQDVAATLQQLFIKKLIEKLTFLAHKTGAKNLYYTGGSALNIVANTRIINSNIFENVFIPPCTEDSGLALGAAAFAELQKHKHIQQQTPFLNNWNIENYEVEYTSETIKEVARLLVSKKVIGLCNGFSEAGPRALGNRSIIALANSVNMSKLISQQKKKREWYRPLAPVALEKNTKYFTGLKNIHPLSKYMLLDFPIAKNKQQEIAGATHADGTARFQTLFSKTDNPFLFDLLTYLDKNHNVKALINTSFNSKGEPIVHTTNDAIFAANNLNLDAVVLNGKLVKL